MVGLSGGSVFGLVWVGLGCFFLNGSMDFSGSGNRWDR